MHEEIRGKKYAAIYPSIVFNKAQFPEDRGATVPIETLDQCLEKQGNSPRRTRNVSK